MERLVLVDDGPLGVALRKTFFGRRGFHLLPVPGNQDLAEIAASRGVDLIISRAGEDPAASLDWLARLRQTEASAEIPVLLTGPRQARARALAAGASAYLPEPWSQRDLLEATRPFFAVDLRADPRAALSVQVVCRQGAQTYLAFTRDISASGLFLKGTSPSPPGTRVHLKFRLPGEAAGAEIEVAAEVVRRAAGEEDPARVGGQGLRFVDLSLVHKIPLTRFVRERTTG